VELSIKESKEKERIEEEAKSIESILLSEAKVEKELELEKSRTIAESIKQKAEKNKKGVVDWLFH